MKSFNILKDGNPILKKHSEPVTVFDQKLKETVIKMIATMTKAGGIGLAAPQVGILKRIVVMSVPNIENGTKAKGFAKVLINPKLTPLNEEKASNLEGCLSFPDKVYEVERCKSVKVSYQDVNGNLREEIMQGLSAICIQHEIDHLNGITFDTKGILNGR